MPASMYKNRKKTASKKKAAKKKVAFGGNGPTKGKKKG
jgi:hypothetical protein